MVDDVREPYRRGFSQLGSQTDIPSRASAIIGMGSYIPCTLEPLRTAIRRSALDSHEIAEQLAHAAGATDGQRAASTERLRQVIRELYRAARRQPGGAWAHAPGKPPEPARTLTEMMGAAGVELDPAEREVLSRYFELFLRSMERTQPATTIPAAEPPRATALPAE